MIAVLAAATIGPLFQITSFTSRAQSNDTTLIAKMMEGGMDVSLPTNRPCLDTG
jgi:hypothetical protein